METILASVCGPARCRTDPMTGLCACALAFSTLLSSQGADAHRPRPLSLIWGNPANLPVLSDLVKPLRKTRFARLRSVYRAYPHFSDPESRIAHWEGGCSPLGDQPPAGSSCLPGAHERLGSKGDLVKSAPRTAPSSCLRRLTALRCWSAGSSAPSRAGHAPCAPRGRSVRQGRLWRICYLIMWLVCRSAAISDAVR
jgi:hypothetical protein